MKIFGSLKTRWIVWVWNHTPNWADMSRLASRSLERPLSLRTRLKMRLHYPICAWCKRYFKQLIFLHEAAPHFDEHANTRTRGHVAEPWFVCRGQTAHRATPPNRGEQKIVRISAAPPTNLCCDNHIPHGCGGATGSGVVGSLAETKMNWLANIVKTLVRGLADLSPGCKTASRLQSEALDRKLPLRQRFGLRVHLVLCKWCRRYGKQITFLRNAAHEHPDEMTEPVPQKLSADARERIRQKLHISSE